MAVDKNNEHPKKKDPSGLTYDIQNQIMGADIDIVDAPYSLHYSSDSVPGHLSQLLIPFRDQNPLPPLINGIKVSVSVAGQVSEQFFVPSNTVPNQQVTIGWNGMDAYGQAMSGMQLANVSVSYTYPSAYVSGVYESDVPAFMATPRLGQSNLPIFRQDAISLGFSEEYQEPLRANENPAQGPGDTIGGWTVTTHHVYNPETKTLIMGDGTHRSALSVNNAIKRVGTDSASLVAVAADGSVVYSDTNNVIRWRKLDGTTTLIGGGGASTPAEGLAATNTSLTTIVGLAVGPDNTVYCAITGGNRLWRIGVDGHLKLIAGTGHAGYSGDGGPATQAMVQFEEGGGVDIRGPSDNSRVAHLALNDSPHPVIDPAIAIAPDSTLYFCDKNNNALRRVGNDGIITTVAGGVASSLADNIPATSAALSAPDALAISPDGNIYIGDASGLHKISPSGIITYTSISNQVTALAFAPNHSLYVVTVDISIDPLGIYHIDELKPDGEITRLAGDAFHGQEDASAFDGVNALQFPLFTFSIAVAPDNTIYFAQDALWRLSQGLLPGLSSSNFDIPSADGSELYEFTGTGKHLRTIDTLTGNTLYQFGYDAAGRLTTVTDIDGDVTTIERNPTSGQPTAIVGADGHTTTLGYDANGWLNSAADPANETFAMTYTTNGLLTQFTNPRQNSSTVSYDASGRLQTEADAAGGVRTLTETNYQGGSDAFETTSMSNNASRYTILYSADGTEYHEDVAPDGSTNRAWIAKNGTTTSQYSDGTVAVSRDGSDPRWGLQAPFTTNSTVTLPSGNQMNILSSRVVTLSVPINPLSVINQTNILIVNNERYSNIYTFDGTNRTVLTISPAQRSSSTTFDTKGRVMSSSVPNITPTYYQHDSRGRLLSISQSRNSQTRAVSYGYDQSQNGSPSSGRLISVVDSLNRTNMFIYDPNKSGHVIQQVFPNGRYIQFQYDANGNITAITPPQKTAHFFELNAVDMLTNYTAPFTTNTSNTFTTYAYNVSRQVTNVTRPDALQIKYIYDAQTAQLDRVEMPFTEQIIYQYIQAGCGCSGAGMPQSVTFDAIDYTNTIQYNYDGSLVTNLSWNGPLSGNVNMTFDNFFRVNALSVNGTNLISFGYDDDGILSQAGAMTLTRDPQNGRLTSTTLNQINDNWVYNNFGDVQSYATQNNTNTLYSTVFARDASGRVVTNTETIGGITNAYSYSYDADRGWLTGVLSNGIAIAHYDYDDNGNRTHILTAAREVTYAAADPQDNILSATEALSGQASRNVTWVYSTNGELLTKAVASATTIYSYDARGALRKVTLPDGTQIEYIIDATGRRVAEKVNGTLARGWLYQDELKPVAELDGSGSVVSRFVYAGKANVPEYMVQGGVTYRIITDQIGSVRLVLDADTGAIEQRLDYDEFGRVLDDTNPGFQPFGFAGGLYDPATSLVHFGARDYDSDSGRWTSKDPVGFAGASANLFTYVDNDPINDSDIVGLYASGQRYEKWGGGLGGGSLTLNGTSYNVTTKVDFIVALKEATEKGDRIATLTYDGHGSPDTGGLYWAAAKDPESDNGGISPQDLVKYLNHFKDLFDACVRVKLNSCGSANPNTFSAADAFKKVFPDAQVTGYTGFYLPYVGGVPNNKFFSHGDSFPNTPKSSSRITK